MNRIVVIGPPGAGKTEFANELGVILGIENVYHLDFYFWKPGWIKTTSEERLSIIEDLTDQQCWIIEGNFLDTIDEQFVRADLIIWLNMQFWISLIRVFNRYLGFLRKKRNTIAPGCKDKITPRFLWSIILYPFVDAKVIRRKITTRRNRPVIILNSPNQVASFIKNHSRIISSINSYKIC